MFDMAGSLRDLGISSAKAVELIEKHFPIGIPAEWADDHAERKVANAYHCAKSEPGGTLCHADRVS